MAPPCYSTVTVTFSNGSGGTGDPGDQLPAHDGDDAWTPVLRLVTDADRQVMQVTWFGGTGAAPSPDNWYIGPSGFVENIGDATTVANAAAIAGTTGLFGDRLLRSSGGGGSTVKATGVVVDDADHVGIGTDSLISRLNVSGSSSQSSQIRANFSGTNASGGGGFLAQHNNAAGALPTTGDRLGYFYAGSSDGSASRNSAGMVAYASGDWTGSSAPSRLEIETTPPGSVSRAAAAVFGSAGATYFPLVSTTAQAANAVLATGGSIQNQLLRSTSSGHYKRDVEDIEDAVADAILGLRPIWYRSKAEADRPDWSWYGLIAEEVAEIDPRLVQWGYRDDAYVVETTECDDGGLREVRSLKPDAVMVPDGVAYDRFPVLLLNIIQRQAKKIEALSSRIAAIEGSAK